MSRTKSGMTVTDRRSDIAMDRPSRDTELTRCCAWHMLLCPGSGRTAYLDTSRHGGRWFAVVMFPPLEVVALLIRHGRLAEGRETWCG